MHPLIGMVKARPTGIDLGLKLIAVVALFGGLAATVMLLLSSSPIRTADVVATTIALADAPVLDGSAFPR